MSAKQTQIPHMDSKEGSDEGYADAYLSNMTGGREE